MVKTGENSESLGWTKYLQQGTNRSIQGGDRWAESINNSSRIEKGVRAGWKEWVEESEDKFTANSCSAE